MNPFLGRVAQDPMFFFWAAVAGCSFISTIILVLIMHLIMRYMGRKAFDKMADEYSKGKISALEFDIEAKDRAIRDKEAEIQKLKLWRGRIVANMDIGEEG